MFRFSLIAALIFLLTAFSPERQAGFYGRDKDPLGLAPNSKFYTLEFDNTVRSWTLVGSKISGGDKVATINPDGAMCGGLAYCCMPGNENSKEQTMLVLMKELGGGPSYLFYKGKSGTGKIENPDRDLTNMGGYGKYIYAQEYRKALRLMIWKDDRFVPVDTLDEDEYYGSADIAVDTAGQAWQFVKNNEKETMDLVGYSPDGKIVKRIRTVGIPSSGNYGMMLINGTFYVANDKKVFPLEYRDKKIYKGKEISFDRSAHDLASDNPGVPVFND